jgi:hypothetical protein
MATPQFGQYDILKVGWEKSNMLGVLVRRSLGVLLCPVCLLGGCMSGSSSERSLEDRPGQGIESPDTDASGTSGLGGAIADASSDASAEPVSDASAQALPDSGFCSAVRGPVTAKEADASGTSVCPSPGLCLVGLEPPPPPPPPGGDEVSATNRVYECVIQVPNGTVIILGDD